MRCKAGPTLGRRDEAVFGGKTKSGVPAWRFRIDKLSAQNLRIRIPAVQFCSLVDMYAFQVLHAL